MQLNNKKRGHLNQEEKVEIYALRKQEISLREIGRILKRTDSTINKELERNSEYLGGGKYNYDALEVNKKSKEKGIKTNQNNTKLLKNPKILKLFEERFLIEADSQGIDEIIGRMGKKGIAMVYPRTMYSFIRRYKPGWERMLRYKLYDYGFSFFY